jgi:hypothetical protein
MPHTLNIDGVSESLFLMQSLVHGSKTFCEKHKIKWGEESEQEFEWEYYFGWLKTTLCEHLIRSSITLRMFQDILKGYDQEGLDLDAHQVAAIDGLTIGIVHEGTFKLTLREAFNKIIHATDTQLDWNEEEEFQWWSGRVWLLGSNRGTEWKLELDVEAFAIATNRLIDSLGGDVDWHHLYKYDT